MNQHLKFPVYAKAALILVGAYTLISMLSIARGILLPMIFAVIIAILISPLVNFLVRKKINRAVAIAGVFFISILILGALITLLATQAGKFIEAMPHLAVKFQDLLNQAVSWTSGRFNISVKNINIWIADTSGEFMQKKNAGLGATLSSMGGFVAAAFLTPIYILMILFYQPHLVQFVQKLFSAGNNEKVTGMMTQTKSIIQSYLIGLFTETGIVAVMNCVGLLVLGIEYAILLGILGAFLNMIPYIGGLIGAMIFMTIALVTKPPIFAFYILLLYLVIQFIDNYCIVPKIIGSKVKLNALISIVSVIAGAALWGIPGMFLAIPVTAIIKLVFDHIDPLKPWGFLLGDSMMPLIKLKK